VRRFVALGRPIRPFGTLSVWRRMHGTSMTPMQCPASDRSTVQRNSLRRSWRGSSGACAAPLTLHLQCPGRRRLAQRQLQINSPGWSRAPGKLLPTPRLSRRARENVRSPLLLHRNRKLLKTSQTISRRLGVEHTEALCLARFATKGHSFGVGRQLTGPRPKSSLCSTKNIRRFALFGMGGPVARCGPL
jgi:hypothetical protein